MIKKILFLLIFIAFTFAGYKNFQSHVFSLHFVDEDENIIAGYYMGKGEKLYKDIFSHKQPLPAVVSMFEQKLQKPNSLYLLIKRHREVVYFYSVFWSIILIVTFGLPGLLFSLIFEIIKGFQLGNMFLSESLVVFPLVYTLGYLWKIFSEKKVKLFETILFSVSLSLIPFLQFTLIPYVIVALFILIVLKKVNVIQLLTFYLLPFTFLFLFCLPFVDYYYYLNNTLSAICSVYLGGTAASSPLYMFYYSFLRPFAAILEMGKSDFGTFTGILSIGYLLSFIYLFFTQKKLRINLIITYIFLGLCSLRIVYPDKALYAGFHGLPWLGAFLFITIYQIVGVLRVASYEFINKSKKLINSKYIILSITIIYFIFLIHNSLFLIQDYYRPSDRETDFYVNYSRFYDYGQTIRILSGKGDKLLVLPAEQLIYWQSGLPHATRFLYVYLFVDPRYKKELYDYWEKTPPAFIYDEDNLSLFKKWWPEYTRIRKGKEVSPLFIRKDKIKSLKAWQINEIKRFGFHL